MEIARRLAALASGNRYTGAQLQIAWLLSQPYGFPVFPIIGPRTPEQLIDCLGSLDIDLTPEQLSYLKPDRGVYIE